MGKNGKRVEQVTPPAEKPGMIERARQFVQGRRNGGDGDGAEPGSPESDLVRVGDRLVPRDSLPKASQIEQLNDSISQLKTGRRGNAQAQLKALQHALSPDGTQLMDVSILADRHIWYMAQQMAWDKMAHGDTRLPIEIFTECFLRLRRSLEGYTLMADMRQAGVDTEADALNRLNKMF